MKKRKVMILLAIVATAAFLTTGRTSGDTEISESASASASVSPDTEVSEEEKTGAKDGEDVTDSSRTSSADGTAFSDKSSDSQKDNTSDSSSKGTSSDKSKNSDSSSSSSKSNSSSSSGKNSKSSSSASSNHTHNWVAQTSTVHHDATGHYETVTVTDCVAYDEQVHDGTIVTCNGCGADLTGMTGEEISLHTKRCDCGYTSQWKYKTIHHEAETHTEQQWVQDTAAYDETVTTGYKCSSCGATK